MANNPFVDVRNPPVSPLRRAETPEEKRRRLAAAVEAERNRGVLLDVPALASAVFGGVKQVGTELAPYARMASPLFVADQAIRMAATPLGFNKPTVEQAQQRLGQRPKPASAAAATTPAGAGGYAPGQYYKHILGIEGGMAADGTFLRSPAGAWGPAQLMPETAPEAMRLAGFRPDDQRWKTDPVINQKAGEAYYNKQLEKYGNPVLAAAAYNAGPGNVDKALARAQKDGGSWTSYLPAETQGYVQKFNQRMSGVPGFQNPFDAGNFAPMLGAINDAERAALTPQEFSVDMPALPEMPDRPEMPKRDFSEQDRLLEAARPIALMEADQKRIQRSNLLAGIAQGLASIPGGAGLGEVLAKVGAGALAGRAAGMEELQKRSDAYEEKMAQFRLLELKYGADKAEYKHQEALQEVQGAYEHNLKKWQFEVSQSMKDNFVRVEGDSFVVQRRNGNQLDVKIVPMAPAIQARYAGVRAQALGQIGSAAQAGDNAVGALTNQWILGAALSDAGNDAQAGRTPEEKALQTTSIVIDELFRNGTAQAVLGPATFAEVTKQAKDNLAAQGIGPGADGYDEQLLNQMQGLTTAASINNPKMRQRIQEAAPTAMSTMEARRYRDRKTTERTDAKGRRSTTEQY